jgi:outer membrane protein assembly factor BamB
LAGGRLWLASNKGLLLGVDAKTGEVATKRELDDAVYISPVVASGRMFVLTDEARLIAMN